LPHPGLLLLDALVFAAMSKSRAAIIGIARGGPQT
jgi:hypothetical protein